MRRSIGELIFAYGGLAVVGVVVYAILKWK